MNSHKGVDKVLDEFNPIGNRDNHFVQKALLNNFSIEINGKKKVHFVDFKNKRVGRRNTSSTYHKKGLYSDDLETELDRKIEAPAIRLINRAVKSKSEVTYTHRELILLRKYLLIQTYRNPLNIKDYSPDNEKDFLGINKASLKEYENYREYVFHKMHEILNSSWDELFRSEDIEIRNNIGKIFKCALLFVRTPDEFVINDLGTACENMKGINRAAFETPGMIAMLREYFASVGIDPTPRQLERYLEQEAGYTNFTFFPVSSDTAMVLVSPIWSYYLDGALSEEQFNSFGLGSQFLLNNYTLGEIDSLDNPDSLDHEVTYQIVPLTRYDGAYLNVLSMNEAMQYVSFKNPEKVRLSFDQYKWHHESIPSFYRDISWIIPELDWDVDQY